MTSLATAAQVRAELRRLATPERAKASAWFFKTGPGQYGEGDVFIGVTVPQQRVVAKRAVGLSLGQAVDLLRSREHEFRLTALLVWVYQYPKADEAGRKAIHQAYLANTAHINNWDLVDSSAEFIVGSWLTDKDRSVLDKLAVSADLWERRIAMLATFCYIKQGKSTDALRIAEKLLGDDHDLIHKAVGWMLREVGKRCGREIEETFLRAHYRTMPRTMLRYAIEHFEPEVRQAYLKGTR